MGDSLRRFEFVLRELSSLRLAEKSKCDDQSFRRVGFRSERKLDSSRNIACFKTKLLNAYASFPLH